MEPTSSSESLHKNGLLSDLSFQEPVSQGRAKTSLRLKYEAEARVGLQKLGGLEGVRQGLGLSQRQISQLLLVDPSAWTRWCKDESKTPPHIIRALEWYLALERKEPAFAEYREHFLKREPSLKALEDWRRQVEKRVVQPNPMIPTTAKIEDPLDDRFEHLKKLNQELRDKLEARQAAEFGWKLVSLINMGFLIWMLVKSLS